MAETVTSAKDDLYEADFFAWTLEAGRRLRRLASRTSPEPDAANLPSRLDIERVAEEIEDLGRSERDAVRSQARRIIEHLLKIECSSSRAPRAGWRRSIIEARSALADKLSASLRRDLQGQMARLYAAARRLAQAGLEEHDDVEAVKRLPKACPYRLDDIIREDWYPPDRGVGDPDASVNKTPT